MRFLRNNPWFKYVRQNLRNNATECESMLWNQLKGKKLGVKFRRQYRFGSYVMDFYCPEIKLGIEVDGEIHVNQIDNDEYRTRTLNQYGVQIVRFANMEVEDNLNEVISKIKIKISTLKLHKLGEIVEA